MNANRILGAKGIGQGSLWQGGVRDTAPQFVRGAFDCVVFTALEFQPMPTQVDMLKPCEVLMHPFDDCELTTTHLRQAIDLANRVARRVRDGKHVLVTCHMGLNRSGLVVALAAHQLTGLSGEQIVRRIQLRREGALSNRSFADAIRRIQSTKRVPHAELGNYISTTP